MNEEILLCDYCLQRVINLDQHFQECSEFIVCDVCSQVIPISQIEDHVHSPRNFRIQVPRHLE